LRPALLLLVLLLLSAGARAQELPHLSDRGRTMVDGALSVAWSNAREPGYVLRRDNVSASANPSWLYFVRDRIGIGAYLGYRFARHDFTDAELQSASWDPVPRDFRNRDHEVSAGFIVALELPLVERLSLFVRPYLGVSLRLREYARVESVQLSPPFAGDGFTATWQAGHEHDTRVQLGVRAPLTYQASDKLGIGFGPDFLYQDLTSRDFASLRIGVSTWLARSF